MGNLTQVSETYGEYSREPSGFSVNAALLSRIASCKLNSSFLVLPRYPLPSPRFREPAEFLLGVTAWKLLRGQM